MCPGHSRGVSKMNQSIKFLAVALLAGVAAQGCHTSRTYDNPLGAVDSPLPKAESVTDRAEYQRSLALQSSGIVSEFEALRASGGWRDRGYFTTSENESAAGLFFRFVVIHNALWSEIDRHGGIELARSDPDDQPRAHILVLHAGLSLADSSASLVALFIDDPVARKKLNEAFHRYEIEAGSYDRLLRAVTSKRRQSLLQAAWQLEEQERRKPDSDLAGLAAEDPAFAQLMSDMEALHSDAAAKVRNVQAHEASGPAEIGQAVSHSEAAAIGRATLVELGDAKYATRSLVFKNVSRIKSPTTHLIHFSKQQKEQLHALLRPGDIILTYTAGYISDVFIPGMFKHGITYVGSTEDRVAVGLDPDSVSTLGPRATSQFRKDLAFDTFPDGTRADLIEAVAEGVKFSNLDSILDTHINRLLVLRPKLSDAERVEFLAGVFTFVGEAYDFRFDFADASRQVCTEVIYRAIDGKGGIAFGLTSRAGHPTLSADDIVDYYLLDPLGAFEFIVFAEADPGKSDNQARVLVGDPGMRRIADLMKSLGG